MAKIMLHIEAEHAADLMATVSALALFGAGGQPLPIRAAPGVTLEVRQDDEDVGPEQEVEPEPARAEPAKRGRGRPRKEDPAPVQGATVFDDPQSGGAAAISAPAPESTTSASTVGPATTTSPSEPTADDVSMAMRVAGGSGKPGAMIKVREILHSYKQADGTPCINSSSVPVDQRAEMIAKLQAI